jgi:hypothetical protein
MGIASLHPSYGLIRLTAGKSIWIATPQRDINRIVDRLTSLREARKSPEGKARIAKLLEDRKRQQAEIDAKKESKNDI